MFYQHSSFSREGATRLLVDKQTVSLVWLLEMSGFCRRLNYVVSTVILAPAQGDLIVELSSSKYFTVEK